MIKTTNMKGFTLIELLLAISIFMSFMVVATNSYIEIIRAQKAANETREVYSEMRNFVDYVNTQMREGGIDYFCYNQDLLSNLDFESTSLDRCVESSTLNIDGNQVLRTISADGLNASVLKFVPPANEDDVGTVCLARFRSTNGSWQNENPDSNSSDGDSRCGEGFIPYSFNNLRVDSLTFEIYPKIDPESVKGKSELQNQIKPMVIMNLSVGSKLANTDFNLDYRTMITARN